MFLSDPPSSEERDRAYASDRDADGYVDNLTRLWCWRPDVLEAFSRARSTMLEGSSLSDREIAVLVAATASARSDSYCSLAWGTRLARLTDEETARQVLTGDAPGGLSERERLLAEWTRMVVRDPNSTTAADVDRLRGAGIADQAIFEATALIAFRLAFSTVNDALGAQPDAQLSRSAPPLVRAAITFGRPIATTDSV